MYGNLGHCQTAYARVRPASGRHHQPEGDLVTSGRIPERHLRGAEVAPHIARMDVSKRHHETLPGPPMVFAAGTIALG